MEVEPGDSQSDDAPLPEGQLSEEVKTSLNQETLRILQECEKEVTMLLTKERKILDRFAQELVEKSELEYDDIISIFNEYGKVNPRSLYGPACSFWSTRAFNSSISQSFTGTCSWYSAAIYYL